MKSPRRFLQWGQFYGKQMQLKCEAWKEMNADITQVDYQIAPLDIIPGAMAVKKFSGAARTLSFADDLGQIGKTTSLTNKAQSSIQKINDLALTAGKQATARLKHVDALIMEREAKILAKLADGAIGAVRVVDETVVNTKNFITDVIPNLKLVPADGVVHPHLLEDLTKGALNKFEGLNIGGGGVPKGAGNKIDSETIKKYIRDIEGRTGRELPKSQIEKLKEALRNK